MNSAGAPGAPNSQQQQQDQLRQEQLRAAAAQGKPRAPDAQAPSLHDKAKAGDKPGQPQTGPDKATTASLAGQQKSDPRPVGGVNAVPKAGKSPESPEALRTPRDQPGANPNRLNAPNVTAPKLPDTKSPNLGTSNPKPDDLQKILGAYRFAVDATQGRPDRAGQVSAQRLEDQRQSINQGFMANNLIPPLQNPNDRPTAFETSNGLRKPDDGQMTGNFKDYKPIFDQKTGDVRAYRKDQPGSTQLLDRNGDVQASYRTSAGYWELKDGSGHLIQSGEKPIQPDVAGQMIAETLATGGLSLAGRLIEKAGEGLIRAGVSEAEATAVRGATSAAEGAGSSLGPRTAQELLTTAEENLAGKVASKEARATVAPRSDGPAVRGIESGDNAEWRIRSAEGDKGVESSPRDLRTDGKAPDLNTSGRSLSREVHEPNPRDLRTGTYEFEGAPGQRYTYDVANNRLVRADLVSGAKAGNRESYRIANAGRQEQPTRITRGIEQPDGTWKVESFDNSPKPGMPVDRGHAAAHAAGGGTDANLFPMNRDLNQIRVANPQSYLWAAGEKYLRENPGTRYWLTFEYK